MTAPTEPAAPPVPPRAARRRWPWALRVLLGLIALLAVGLSGGALWVIDRPLVLSPGVQARIEARLDARLTGYRLRFGEVQVVMQSGMRPSLRLRDVTLAEAGAPTPFASLRELETSLSRDAFLAGELALRSVRLSGANALLRRTEDGLFQLAVGEARQPIGAAPSLAGLIEGLDRVLTLPGLAKLDRIAVEGLSLRFEDARAARAWNIDGGRVTLTRSQNADGDAAGDVLSIRADAALLGGFDFATVLDARYDSRIGARAASASVRFTDLAAGDLASQVPALAWLAGLRAPIAGELRSSVAEDGSLGPLSGSLQIGAGVLQPTEATAPVPFDAAQAFFTFHPDRGVLQFDELSVTSRWVTGRAAGQVILEGLSPDGRPAAVVGQVTLDGMTVGAGVLGDAPLRLERVWLDGRLRLDPFVLHLGQVTVQDQGLRALARGRITAAPDGWEVALDAALPGGAAGTAGPAPTVAGNPASKPGTVDLVRLLALWPGGLAPKARAWVVDNMQAARVRDLHFVLRMTPGAPPRIDLGGSFDQARFRALRGLPDVMDAAGWISLTGHRFAAVIEQAQMQPPDGGLLDLAGSAFVVPDVRVVEGPAETRLTVAGPLPALLSVLDQPPLRLMQKAGQPVTLADGRVTATARLDFPLRRRLTITDVAVAAEARITDATSRSLIPGRELTAAQLTARLADNVLTIAGPARLGAVPMTGAVRIGLAGGGAQVTADVELSQRFLDEFRISLPRGTVTGTGQGQLTLDLSKGADGAFRLTSDLRGLGLAVPQIGWRLPAAGRGRFEITGRLGTPFRIDRLALDAPGLRGEGRLTLTASGGLDRLDLPQVRIGGWLEAPVTLVGRGARPPEVSVSGGWIDLRRTSVGGGGGAATDGGGPVALKLDRLIVSEGIVLTGFTGTFDTAQGFDGSFAARVNGQAAVTGRVVPQDGRSAFRILSDDAGAVFGAAGLLKKAAGGALDLTMRPASEPGSYDGVLRVTDVRLRDAPAMAEMLSALSIVGLLEQMGGQGIPFSEVDADFRLTPTRASILRSSAIGASLGLSMDGTYDLATGEMAMQGVVSPLYLFNAIGSVLTRKGEGLIGFSYRLSGTADAPRVQVNPLSILTPGMFREIFRRPAPKVSP